ncbi:MAG: hypothetical protein LBN37_08450, partial [Bacteroidales bacterium]|nr:hypothetical protein [Bacteroidales bacterium]
MFKTIFSIKSLAVIFLMSVAAVVSSCKDDKDADPTLSLTPAGQTEVKFKADGSPDGNAAFAVATNQASWKAESNKPWATVSKSADGKSFTVSAAPNTAYTAPDEATVTISAGTATPILISATQAAALPSVYVAGSDGNVATVWKNGTATPLTDGTKDAEARSVYVSGTDVYTAGYEGNVAKVWINGTAQNLTDGTKDAVANSVYVSGTDVYAAGSEHNNNYVATVWKNGTVLNNLTDGTKSAEANSVYVSGTDVYAAGYENNGNNYVAKVWKNGTVLHNLTNGTYHAIANSV